MLTISITVSQNETSIADPAGRRVVVSKDRDLNDIGDAGAVDMLKEVVAAARSLSGISDSHPSAKLI